MLQFLMLGTELVARFFEEASALELETPEQMAGLFEMSARNYGTHMPVSCGRRRAGGNGR
jgi:hypothetical protein